MKGRRKGNGILSVRGEYLISIVPFKSIIMEYRYEKELLESADMRPPMG